MSVVELLETDLLDPRPAAEALATPIAGAAAIPLEELPGRTYELPPRSVAVRVAGPRAVATDAAAWLTHRGWHAEAAPMWEYAAPAEPAATPRRYRLWRPAAIVSEVAPQLAPGRALDLGCGSGRDAVYLAAAGWEVVGVDILPDALERAADRARRYAPNVRITWVCADVEREADRDHADRPEFGSPGSFDLVLGVRFLSRRALARCAEWLRPGGSVLWETFTAEHRARHGRPASPARVVQPGELPALLPGFAVVHYSESWDGPSHVARLWAKLESGA